MNTMPKTFAAALTVVALLVAPADACMSFGPGTMALILAVVAVLAAGPTTLAVAGLVSAYRARLSGMTARRGLVVAAALVCELAAARALGPSSLVGLAALGAGAIQTALVAMAFVNGPLAPLNGKITVLSAQALGL